MAASTKDDAVEVRGLAVARLFMVELAHFPELGKSLWKAVEDEQGGSMIEYFRSHQRKQNIRPMNLALLSELFLRRTGAGSTRRSAVRALPEAGTAE